MKPHNIKTGGTRVLKVIRNTGPHGFSVAKLMDRNNQQFYGMRWNGESDSDVGYPNARGYPVWFSIPDEIERIIIPHYEIMTEVRGMHKALDEDKPEPA
jgi:hypothetical protein